MALSRGSGARWNGQCGGLADESTVDEKIIISIDRAAEVKITVAISILAEAFGEAAVDEEIVVGVNFAI